MTEIKNRTLSKGYVVLIAAVPLVFMTSQLAADDAVRVNLPVVKMTLVKAEEPAKAEIAKYRKILVSPTINTPKPFRGFGGFCGWPVVCKLSNGDLYVTFTAGYWHASLPTPIDFAPKYRAKIEKEYPWLMKWDSPEGMRRMWIRSSDNGKTWTRPKSFPVTPAMRGVTGIRTLTQLRDGTMLAAANVRGHHGYSYNLPVTSVEFARVAANRLPSRMIIFRSDDNGETWKELTRFPGPGLLWDTPCTLLEDPNGHVLLLSCGVPLPAGWGPNKEARFLMAMMRSSDKGRHWTVLSILGSNDLNVEEGTAAYLPDGSIGTPSRSSSAWYQSYDNGLTWTKPRALNEYSGPRVDRAVFKQGSLVVTPDGVAVLVFCGRPGGSGQVIYSRDSGKTWIKPAKDRGFKYDPHSYYPRACVLEDGSIFVVGDHQGFKNKFGPYGSESVAIRFRIKTPEEGEGIELLPIGGPPLTVRSASRHRDEGS